MKGQKSESHVLGWESNRTIIFGLLISALSLFSFAPSRASAFDKSTANKKCFEVQYEIRRGQAESRGYNSRPIDVSARNRQIESNCSALIKMWGKIQRDFETTLELVRLISESPSGLSGFNLDPELLPSEIASGIDKSRINAMDDFINPAYNVQTSCKNGMLIRSWQRVWGSQTPTADFTHKISEFCKRLDTDYAKIMESSSRNLRTMMRQSHTIAIESLQQLKSECEGMTISGNVSKQRAAQIRNDEVANIVSRFQFEYDPYKPSGGLVMNNELQASLIGKADLAKSLSSLNYGADQTRVACAHVLINY